MTSTEIQFFFELGFSHIIDRRLAGLDHILFIVVLSAVYQLNQWRKILVLVTAFTLGHSLTLALAVFGVIAFNRELIEMLIPITILLTAIFNFYEKPTIEEDKKTLALDIRYFFAVAFGFIHGFAFSNVLQEMFAVDKESLVWKLLVFNIGLEVGQIIVVIVFLIISTILILGTRLKPLVWNTILSGLGAILAIKLLLEKIY